VEDIKDRREMSKKPVHKRININKDGLMTELAIERTILAKQRTLLAEISILFGLIGLSLFLNRFFVNYFIGASGIIVSLGAFVMVLFRLAEYKKFNRKIKKIDRRHHFF